MDDSTRISTPPLVLAIGSDPRTRAAIDQALTSLRALAVFAESAQVAQRRIREGGVALILLDMELADRDARDFLRDLREHPEDGSMPVILLTRADDVERVAECFTLGADLYLPKPPHPAMLASAIAARLTSQAESRKNANRDELTGLPSRARFHALFDKARQQAQRSGKPLALGVLDIDRFQRINNIYGKAFGDRVLATLGKRLPELIGGEVALARWSGGEFVCLFPDQDVLAAKAVLVRVQHAVQELLFDTDDGHKQVITFSAGVALVDANDNVTQAVARADKLLYFAKTTGGIRVLAESEKVAPPVTNIVLAEDDNIIASLVQHRLRKEGYVVRHFTNGLDALEAVRASPPSLVLSDLMMPKMDGLQFLTTVRSTPELKGLPFIIITAVGDETAIVKGLELGADDYVTKPFSPVELVSRIHRLLKRASDS